MVSYNILADAYASTKFAREQLYAYCRAEALSVEYRKQLVAWELGQYHADVLCLQEVSRHVFESYLEPVLAARGYHGVYANKMTPHTPIGCATFFRRSRLQLLQPPEVIDLTQSWRQHPDLAAVATGTSAASCDLAQALAT